MANNSGPDETGRTGPGDEGKPQIRDDDLERRRRQLAETLAARRRGESEREQAAKSGGNAGYGEALKLSSEFVAGVAVGAIIGWLVDRLAGVSPWGLIIFLLLGFGAGVLNVLRSSGVIAEAGLKGSGKGTKDLED